jgi:hypothetical protein
MQFGQAQVELSPDGEHDFGQQRRRVGIEQPIQGAPDAIIPQLPYLPGAEPKQCASRSGSLRSIK